MLKCKFSRHFSAAEVLENNKVAAFHKSHALCHHSEMDDRGCVIQHDRPDMRSYKMADRT